MGQKRNLIANIYQRISRVARKVTPKYEDTFGTPCDVYFPVHGPQKGRTYQRVNIFEGHELPYYSETPDLCCVYFVIIGLMRKESMSSIADQFDTFQLKTDKKDVPYIETDPDRELPLYSKVVAHIGASTKSYFVNKKTVVNGAGEHMLMRMYLAPLTADSKGEYEKH